MIGLATRRKKAKEIRYLLLDVDGVLTNGMIYVNHYGVETLGFSVYDGHGIKQLQQIGIGVGFLSGRTSAAAAHRAKELAVEEVHFGILDKLPVYEQIRASHRLTDAQICYIGDDLLDLPVIQRVGLSVAPPNAIPEIKSAADWITAVRGGEGAVREVTDFLLAFHAAPSASAKKKK